MLVFGAGLFVAPTFVGPLWPWTLTALTGRAVGAWLIGMGFAALHGWREDDLSRIQPLAGGYIAFGALQLVALARFPGDMHWDAIGAWVYVAFIASVLPVGLFGWFGPRRKRTA
jgi:hypothetical protein